MPEYTGKDLNLIKPLMSDYINETMPNLAANMQAIDDAVTVINSDLTDKTNILNFPVTNIVFNGDFNNDVSGWSANACTIAAASYEMVCSYTESAGYAGAYQFPAVIASHIYYVAVDFYPKHIRTFHLFLDGTTSDFVAPVANAWNHASLTVKAVTNGSAAFTLYHDVSAQYIVGDTWKYRRAIVIDLTAAFGAGNEPSAAEMDYLMSSYTNNWFGGTVNPFRGLKDIGIRALTTDLPAKNLISNGNFANGTTGWLGAQGAILSAANNELSETAVTQYDGAIQSISTTQFNGHKVYFAADVKLDNGNTYLIFNDGLDQAMLAPTTYNAYQKLSSIWTVNVNAAYVFIKLQDNRASAWTTQYMKNAIVIDLTATFGAGNEPSVAEMDRLLAKFPNGWFDGTVNPLLSVPELMIYVNKNKANKVQEDWIAPTLTNSWVADSGYTVAFRKDAFGRVWLKGTVKNGILNAVLFTLPVGYRPLQNVFFVANSSYALGVGHILTDGSVTLFSGNASQFSIDGISFSTN